MFTVKPCREAGVGWVVGWGRLSFLEGGAGVGSSGCSFLQLPCLLGQSFATEPRAQAGGKGPSLESERCLGKPWVSLGQPVTPNSGPGVMRPSSQAGGTSEVPWGQAVGRLYFVTWIPGN